MKKFFAILLAVLLLSISSTVPVFAGSSTDASQLTSEQKMAQQERVFSRGNAREAYSDDGYKIVLEKVTDVSNAKAPDYSTLKFDFGIYNSAGNKAFTATVHHKIQRGFAVWMWNSSTYSYVRHVAAASFNYWETTYNNGTYRQAAFSFRFNNATTVFGIGFTLDSYYGTIAVTHIF